MSATYSSLITLFSRVARRAGVAKGTIYLHFKDKESMFEELIRIAIVPLVGTEFVPQADEGFISLRLNTPVGSSLEYSDGKVRQVEAALKSIPEIALTMTTIGTDEGRNYARVNLKLVERKDRARNFLTLRVPRA